MRNTVCMMQITVFMLKDTVCMMQDEVSYEPGRRAKMSPD